MKATAAVGHKFSNNRAKLKSKKQLSNFTSANRVVQVLFWRRSVLLWLFARFGSRWVKVLNQRIQQKLERCHVSQCVWENVSTKVKEWCGVCAPESWRESSNEQACHVCYGSFWKEPPLEHESTTSPLTESRLTSFQAPKDL